MQLAPIRVRKQPVANPYEYLFDRSVGRPRHWPSDACVTLVDLGPGVVRMDMRSIYGRHRRHVYQLGHGIMAETSTIETSELGVDVFEPKAGMLELVAVTEGVVRTLPEDPSPDQPIAAGQGALHLPGVGELSATRLLPRQQVSWVALTCCPARLAADFGIENGEVRLREAFSTLTVRRLDTAVHRLVRDLIDLDGAHPMTRMRMEAGALELLARLMTPALKPAKVALPAAVPTQMSPREVKQLQDVRALLSTCFEEPPTISDLARRVGTNQSKLMRGFKSLYGETVADFTRRQRMERAYALLVDERLSVAEVAYRVGYQHHSSFTFAFSRFFGTAPSQVNGDERSH